MNNTIVITIFFILLFSKSILYTNFKQKNDITNINKWPKNRFNIGIFLKWAIFSFDAKLPLEAQPKYFS